MQVEPAGQVGRTAAFRVTGLQPQSQPLSQAGRILGTFIGRGREVSLLDGLLTQVLAGKGHAVSVVGEPGMGKSRLVYEATQSMAARPEGVAILEGRCVSYGSLVPYLPLIDLLRAHCQIAETDPPEVVRDAIDRAVRANGLQADAGTWLLRLIGIVDEATARDSLSPEAIKARTFDALRMLLLKASAQRPLVIVAEDVHWIDRTSEEFLATLVGQLVAARILLIATYRPGYRAPWMERSYVTQITIGPLSAGESAQLLGSVAGDQRFAAEVSSAILERGEGNPFFLEELARTVVEQGAGDHAIPETVQGVIMARLDRLPDAAKQLLQTASVVGREVPLRLLARLSPGRDLDAPLAELCRQEFMYERRRRRAGLCLQARAHAGRRLRQPAVAQPPRASSAGRARARGAVQRSSRRDHRDARVPLRAHGSDRRGGDVAAAGGGTRRPRLCERRGHPPSRPCGAAAAASARRRRSRSPHARRGASTRALAVFPGPLPREHRRAPALTRPGCRGSPMPP